MAERLSLGEGTVEAHVRHVLAKLDIASGLSASRHDDAVEGLGPRRVGREP